jgi:cap2 methyltransferase
MQPKAGMYKFRLPWAAGSSRYLAGDVFLPIWGPQTTTETRLVVQGSEIIDWDHKSYEERMFYFNSVNRCFLYMHDVVSHGLDHCFDCSSEAVVLKRYLRKYAAHHFKNDEISADGFPLPEPLARVAGKFVHRLTKECGGSAHGRNLVTWQKRTGFEAKVFDVEQVYYSSSRAYTL